jgi:hypothetical protein
MFDFLSLLSCRDYSVAPPSLSTAPLLAAQGPDVAVILGFQPVCSRKSVANFENDDERHLI